MLDRLGTEVVNARTVDLDLLSTTEVLERISDEDMRAPVLVRAAIRDIARAVDAAAAAWQRGGRVRAFGAGTSGRLAALDAAELVPTFGIPAERYEACIAGGADAFLHSVEGAEDDMTAGHAAARGLGPCDVAIGVAASGRTPFVMAALDEARTRGATTIGIACTAQPALAAVADIVIAVDTGPEVIAGSTRMKAGTVQKMVLNALSTALMVRVGRVYGNRMVEMQVTNEKLRQRATRLVGDIAGVDEQRARTALTEADGDLKTAIAALRLGIPATVARERLRRFSGSLRRALNEGHEAGEG